MATKSNFSDITNCDFTARKYVLKTKRSHWTKHRSRPIVYSPVTDLPGSAEKVIVRRLDKENQNQEFLSQDICLIDKKDIEPDTAKIYKRDSISQEPVTQRAHGVVLGNEISSNGCQFLRGDRLWLMIGYDTNTDIKDIPVMNLRSLEAGTVRIDNVCWYPVARDEKESLLTFGGVSRKWRSGREWRYMNWVIAQHSDLKVMWCKVINLDETTRLTGTERGKLFMDKLQLLDPMLSRNYRGELISPSASLTPSLSSFSRSKETQAIKRTLFWLKFMDAKDQSFNSSSVAPSDNAENSSETHSELENMFRSKLQSIEKEINDPASEEIKKNQRSELAISFVILFSCQQVLLSCGQSQARTPMNSIDRPAFDVTNPIITKNPHLISTSFSTLRDFQEDKGYLFGSPFDLLRGEDRVMHELSRLMEEVCFWVERKTLISIILLTIYRESFIAVITINFVRSPTSRISGPLISISTCRQEIALYMTFISIVCVTLFRPVFWVGVSLRRIS